MRHNTKDPVQKAFDAAKKQADKKYKAAKKQNLLTPVCFSYLTWKYFQRNLKEYLGA